MVLSSDGTRLYVMKSSPVACNVGVIDTTMQAEIAALPAPANCVDVQISGDDRFIYDLVGTPVLGNIQVFNLGS